MPRQMLCIVLALLLAAVGLGGCASFSAISPQTVTWLDVFNTVSTLTVYGVEADSFQIGAEALHDRLLEYHRLFDIYHSYDGMNNLKTVNDHAGQPVTVAEPILDLLEYGLTAYEQTGGRVNILFGSVLMLWHDSRTQALESPAQAALPDPAALSAAAAHTDPVTLVIDREAGTVCLTDPDSRLDVGAVAKGYAVELAAKYAAEELGITTALLDVGGNVRAIGGKPAARGQTPFLIGVRNPEADSARPYLKMVGLRDMAAVTSGDDQRYFEVDGKRYNHIIDPDTLQPATRYRSVTVLCPDSGLADVLSTALFILPLQEGLNLLGKFKEAEALWVLPDGSLRQSADFEVYEK